MDDRIEQEVDHLWHQTLRKTLKPEDERAEIQPGGDVFERPDPREAKEARHEQTRRTDNYVCLVTSRPDGTDETQ